MPQGPICLGCLSRNCPHLARTKPPLRLTPAEQLIILEILRCDALKVSAERLNLTDSDLANRLGKIYRKFGWSGAGSLRRLVVWGRENSALLYEEPA